jgi:predicted metal-binding transcription factor (methanogenesis marker protein 9)
LRVYGGGCGVEGGTCPLCQGEQSATHILLNCQETQRLRENFLDKKWLQMNMAVAFKKLVWSSKITDLRQLHIILYEIRCKLEHHAKQSGGGGGRIIVVVVIS